MAGPPPIKGGFKKRVQERAGSKVAPTPQQQMFINALNIIGPMLQPRWRPPAPNKGVGAGAKAKVPLKKKR
jgi:hypothetical protein